MVERGMGCGRVPERTLCPGADCARWATHCDRDFDAPADFYHGAFAVFAVVGDSRTTLWAHGVGAWRQRRGHEYQSDGASASAFYGTRPEYFLFLWHVSAGGIGAGGGLGRIADQPGGGVWCDRGGVCG